MVAIAALGRRAAASAWSASEEERRKAMFSYFTEGVAFIVWDNLPRGATISCPSIEKALTADFYSDRVLGESATRTVPASSIQAFTGNNIAPRGDMASRSLSARLAVDRPDPENREFVHPDPLAWTEANRGKILRALYTVALGNPRLRAVNPEAAKTRFKMWWHLVGSAVEYAAEQHGITAFPGNANWNVRCPPQRISFAKLFLDGEADEEQTSSLATVLEVMRSEWKNGASDVAAYAGRAEEQAIAFKAALEQASGKAIKVITSSTLTWRLKAIADAPVKVGDEVLVLRHLSDHQGATFAVGTAGR